MVIRDAKKINPEMSYPSCQTVTPVGMEWTV